MNSDFEGAFAPPRAGGVVPLYAYASLGMAAAIFFLALFLHIPIATEARDYVLTRGYLAQMNGWLNLVYPVGANWRVTSMAVFAASRDACGFGAVCLNTIQIAQLLLCVFFGAIHLHQLLRRPALVVCCLALWCLSLPVFVAGLWQATQHDKLAFLLSLAALSFGFSALRRQPRGARLVADTAVLLVLFCLALNAKEIAFFLPFAAIAQVALLGPAGTLRARVQAGRVYVLPVAYAVIYITIYMLRLTAPLRSHVLGGVLLSNARFYFLALMGRQASSVLISALALAVLAAATGFALLPLRGEARPVARGGARVLAYLAVIFAANIGLVAGAQFPDDFYLLIAEWAFLSLAAASFVLLQGAVRVVRLSGLAALGVLLVVFLHKRAGDLFVWGNGEVLREAHVLAADYAQLRPYCGAPMAQGMKFVMPTRPLGFFYFFRGGNDGPDQLLPMFICERPVAAAMAYSYDGNATPDRPDELIVTFTRDFSVASVSQK